MALVILSFKLSPLGWRTLLYWANMYYVYLIKSLQNSNKTYTGYTADLHQRLATHNSGGCEHTSKYKPWYLVSYIAFDSETKALEFEKYIKVGSGHAFAKKRLW